MSIGEGDLQRASLLFEVVEKCAGHPNRFASIASAALEELDILNAGIRQAAIAARKALDDAKVEAAAQAPKAIPSSEVVDASADASANTPTLADRRI